MKLPGNRVGKIAVLKSDILKLSLLPKETVGYKIKIYGAGSKIGYFGPALAVFHGESAKLRNISGNWGYPWQ
jgi:hypothetical protein